MRKLALFVILSLSSSAFSHGHSGKDKTEVAWYGTNILWNTVEIASGAHYFWNGKSKVVAVLKGMDSLGHLANIGHFGGELLGKSLDLPGPRLALNLVGAFNAYYIGHHHKHHAHGHGLAGNSFHIIGAAYHAVEGFGHVMAVLEAAYQCIPYSDEPYPVNQIKPN